MNDFVRSTITPLLERNPALWVAIVVGLLLLIYALWELAEWLDKKHIKF